VFDTPVENEKKGYQRDAEGQIEIAAEIRTRGLYRAIQEGQAEDQRDIDDVAAQCVAQTNLGLAGERGDGGDGEFRAGSGESGQRGSDYHLRYTQVQGRAEDRLEKGFTPCCGEQYCSQD
jgi:hypothetical protein